MEHSHRRGTCMCRLLLTAQQSLIARIFLGHYEWSAVFDRIDRGEWISLPYVAACETLGWETPPLVVYRVKLYREREEERLQNL